MKKRNYIFDTIRSVYEKYGFVQIETPAMENLSVLTGKYGEEGDQLLFKLLNSGDFLAKVTPEAWQAGSPSVLPQIAEKGLRYDLTVPFARYVAMHREEITFPFKRYQIQPVWRADRPQKGRYREFYQCDADVVGTDGLICEAEMMRMLQEVFQAFGLTDFTIQINHRKVLTGIAEVIGAQGKAAAFYTAMDKLDKIGKEAVLAALMREGFTAESIKKLEPIFAYRGSLEEQCAFLKDYFSGSEAGLQGLSEVEETLGYLHAYGAASHQVQLCLTLARGLSYYTGMIFEVKTHEVQMGSIAAGGRYDHLTSVFGLKGVSGVGISFGVERIYDVLSELDLYPYTSPPVVQVMVSNFGGTATSAGIRLLQQLRQNHISSEIYPSAAKMKKQLAYAHQKSIPFVVLVGEEELTADHYALKNMKTGEQKHYNLETLIAEVKALTSASLLH